MCTSSRSILTTGLQTVDIGSADELSAANDFEMFDLKVDPAEMTNLAPRKGQHAALVMTMSNKLEARIEAEMALDDGRGMPEFKGMD